MNFLICHFILFYFIFICLHYFLLDASFQETFKLNLTLIFKTLKHENQSSNMHKSK